MTLGLRRLDRTKICHIFAGCRRLRWLCHSLVRAAVRLPKSVVVIGYRSPAPAASARRCHEKLCVAVISVDIGVKGLCPRIYVPPCVPALIWNVNSWSQMRNVVAVVQRDRGADSLVLHMHAVGRSEVVDDVVGARVDDDGVVAADVGAV